MIINYGVVNYELTMTQWIGFRGKILTGNHWVFTIKLVGGSG